REASMPVAATMTAASDGFCSVSANGDCFQ
ncbi:hypothetical protein A2U01_0069538, partial [Trifolium medium]|nr:hypothetical protein [Trifolium medium]